MSATNQSITKKLKAEYVRDQMHKLSKSLGIYKWDIGVGYSFDNSVQIDKGEAKQLKVSQRSSLTLRVWSNSGTVGVSSTTDISEEGLSKALESAHYCSNYGNKEDVPDFSKLANETLPELHYELKPQQGIKAIFNQLKEAESSLLSGHSSIDSVPYNSLSEGVYERCYINSCGSFRDVIRTQSSLYLYAKTSERNLKPRSSGALRVAYGSMDLDIAGCVKETLEKTLSHLNYKPINTGKYTVRFTPEAFLDLIGAFSNIFNARSIIDGVSLSTLDSIGTRVAVSDLSIHDNGNHLSNIGATGFDGEGTPTQNIELIDKGILKNCIHSESTARKFGVQPTGHAGIGAKVSVSPDWLIVSNSNKNALSDNSVLASSEYVLIDNLNALHAGVKASQGSFSLPFDGWLVNEGRKVSIEAATVAGDIRQVLQQIILVEQDQHTTHQGISPYIWVDNLSITGEQ